MDGTSARRLLAPTLITGALMAAFLVLRPYGDSGSAADAADAFGSTWWVIAHVCGALALAAFAAVCMRLTELVDSSAARLSRTSSLVGIVLALPYFGAESFGLHILGQHEFTGSTTVALADEIRYQPIAIVMFAAGLILFAVAGIALALAWSRSYGGLLGQAAWPLGIAIAVFAPQFVLPPMGRIGFGLVFLAAAAVFAYAVHNAENHERALA